MEILLEKSLQAQVQGYIGRGVLSAKVADGHLLFAMTDGSQVDLGEIKGQVDLDSTLTQTGMAADAGATGQRLGQLDTELQQVRSGASAAESLASSAQSVASTAQSQAATAQETAQQAQTYAQEALAQQGQLSALETTAQDTLVEAINEVNGKIGGKLQWFWVDLTGRTSIPYSLLPNESWLTVNLLVRDSSGVISQFLVMTEAGRSFSQSPGTTYTYPYANTTLRLIATSTGLNINCSATYQLVGLYYAKGTAGAVTG